MSTEKTQIQALFFARKKMNLGHSEHTVRNVLDKAGFTANQIDEIMSDVSIVDKTHNTKLKKPIKNEENIMKQRTEENLLGDSFTKLIEIAIVYGVPTFLLVFGAGYVYQQMSIDLNSGLRSLAAVILPIVITMSFRNTPIRANAIDFLTEQKIVSFVITFVLTFAATAIAMIYRSQSGNIIPVGELVFSSTLALMIFGSDSSGRGSFLHVGAVSGFLTYVILFGLAI